MYKFKIAAHSISYANSCLNPCVYSFIGDGFRKALRKAFPALAARATVSVGPHGRDQQRSSAACCANQVGSYSGSVSPVPGPSHTRSSDVINLGGTKSRQPGTAGEQLSGGRSDVRPGPEVVLRPRPECAVFSGLGNQGNVNSLAPVMEVEGKGYLR